MAINPESQYPGKIAPASPEFPYGSARNVTVPGDGTGTPWEAALVNDLFGFQQALLSAAGIVPSGNPDEVGASQYLTALFKTSGFSSESVQGALSKDLEGVRVVNCAGFASAGDSGAGSVWYATGATTPGSAGTVDRTAGALYDVNGVEFKYAFARVNMLHFGDFGGGIVDPKLAAEELSQFAVFLYFPSTQGESYVFSAAPSLASGTTCQFDSASAFSGATADELNAEITEGGAWHGYPFAPELRDKRIEIVAGSIRQQAFISVSIVSTGTTATVTQTAHGYSNGDNVHIDGAAEGEYNGFFAISNVTENTYDYTLPSATTSPATGAPQGRKPAQWDLIKDASHSPVGVLGEKFTAVGGTITVPFNKTFSAIIPMIVGPDETLANAHNLTVGASVGTSSMGIQCGATLVGESLIRWNGSTWAIANGTGQVLNFDPTFEDDAFGQDSVRISHDYCPGIGVQVSPWAGSGAVPFVPCIQSIGNTDMVLKFIDYAGAYVNNGAESVNMQFKLTKSYSEGITLDGTNESYKLPLQNGNLWFFGLFEV